MILFIRKIIFIFIISKFKSYKKLSFVDLNFRKIDFTNYKLIKSYIFKENFYELRRKIGDTNSSKKLANIIYKELL